MNINVHVEGRPDEQAPLLGLELLLLLCKVVLFCLCHQKPGQLIHHLTAPATPPPQD